MEYKSPFVSIAENVRFSYTVLEDPVGPYYFASVGGENILSTGTYKISVTQQNSPPNAVNDRFVAIPGVSYDFEILANDTDADGDALGISSIKTSPSKGIVEGVVGSTTLTYTPNASESGIDTFTYEVTDNRGGLDTAVVTVDLRSFDHEPIIEIDAPEFPGLTTFGFNGSSVTGVLNGWGFDNSDFWYVGEISSGRNISIEFSSSAPPATAVGGGFSSGLSNPTLKLFDSAGNIVASDFGIRGHVQTVSPTTQNYWVSIEKTEFDQSLQGLYAYQKNF